MSFRRGREGWPAGSQTTKQTLIPRAAIVHKGILLQTSRDIRQTLDIVPVTETGASKSFIVPSIHVPIRAMLTGSGRHARDAGDVKVIEMGITIAGCPCTQRFLLHYGLRLSWAAYSIGTTAGAESSITLKKEQQ
ncbi:hypothetical protein BaRGS_00039556 [Batillaria attramentaria]|uniref:Uncharacterized protein n=1 Tax=Batillaria attramentaria TaxID=370345 RepID=A0ABD0J2M7_9CAEN